MRLNRPTLAVLALLTFTMLATPVTAHGTEHSHGSAESAVPIGVTGLVLMPYTGAGETSPLLTSGSEGGARVAAWHSDAAIHLRVETPGQGWHLVAIPTGVERSIPMNTGTMRTAEHVGVLVPGAARAEAPSVVTFGRLAHGGHGAAKIDGYVAPHPDATGARVTVTREGGQTVTHIELPKSLLPSGLEGGSFSQVLVASSPHTTPPRFFLSERPHDLTLLPVYVGRAGEGTAELLAVARVLEQGPRAPEGAVAAGAIGVGALLVLLVLWGRREVAPPGTGVDPFVERLIAAVQGRARSRDARRFPALARWGSIGALLVMVVPVFAPLVPAQYLPGPLPSTATGPGASCLPDQPVRRYNVSAIDIPIVYNRFGDYDPEGNMYVLTENIPALLEEKDRIDEALKGNGSFPTGADDSLFVPLVLRVHQGECLEIRFTNMLLGEPPEPPAHEEDHLPPVLDEGAGGESSEPIPPAAIATGNDRRASIHVHGLPLDPKGSDGSAVGWNPDTTVAIGQSITYRIHAAWMGEYFFHDHGDTTSLGTGSFRGLGPDFRGSTTHGLFGAIIVEPAGSQWRHPSTGEPVRDGWKADILLPDNKSYREFVIFYHDPQVIGKDDLPIPEPMTDHGFNYRTETMSRRLFDDDARCSNESKSGNNGINPCHDPSLVYSSFVHGDPGTPIPRAYMKDRVKFHFLHAGVEESHVHHMHNHRWRAVEGNNRSSVIDAQLISPGETWTQSVNEGAGGESFTKSPGDSIYHCHLFPHLYGGMWGIFRTHDRLEDDLKPLPDGPLVPPPKEPGSPGFPDFLRFGPHHDEDPEDESGSDSSGSASSSSDEPENESRAGKRPPRPPQTAGFDPLTGLTIAAPGAPYADPCPPTAPVRKYSLVAIDVTIQVNGHGDHARSASVYALKEDAAALHAGTRNPEPVVLRAAVGECIVVQFENRLPPLDPTKDVRLGLIGNKASIHPHLHSFDVLGSDGVAIGYNYDTGVFPGENITYRYYADEELGTIVWHDHTSGLRGVTSGLYGGSIIEPAGATWRDPATGGPLYTQGADLSDDFLDSSYNPATKTWARLSHADILGPGFQDFREFFLSLQDFTPVLNRTGTPYRPQVAFPGFDDFGLMGFNYRSEPLFHRTWAGTHRLFDSSVHGDPATPLLEAYPGDRVVLRLHQVPFEEVHSFTLQGHRWRFGPNDPTSPLVDTVAMGVSESFNIHLEGGAGGPLRIPGDYLYRGGPVDDYFAGAWGIFRVHAKAVPHLLPLADAPSPWPARASIVDPCPPGAPVKTYLVHAIQKELIYNGHGDHDAHGMMWVMNYELEWVKRGTFNPEPLTLRVTEGDCVHIRLQNDLPEWTLSNYHAFPQPTGGSRVYDPGAVNVSDLLDTPYARLPQVSNRTGIAAHLLQYDIRDSGGSRIGFNPDTTIGPGETRTYRFYADTPRINLAFLEDLADPITHRAHGLFGGIVVMPKGTRALDPRDGTPEINGALADVWSPKGAHYRNAVLYWQNGVPLTSPDGYPVPVREPERPSGISEANAAQRALAVLNVFYGHHADKRAVVERISPMEGSWLVQGRIDNRTFHATFDADRASLLDFRTSADPRALGPGGFVQLSNPGGMPIAGKGLRLERTGGTLLAYATTDAQGRAHFPGILDRASLLKVRVNDSGVDVSVRTDSEGRFRVFLRGDFGPAGFVEQAADRALAYLQDSHLPPGPLGVTGVDARGALWRVTAEDALRVYHLEIRASDGHVVALTLESRAVSLSTPSYLATEVLERVARQFLKTHWGDRDLTLIGSYRDRFGVWYAELDGNGWSNSIGIDGATGRVLSLLRVPDHPNGLAVNLDPTAVWMRIRADDGRHLEGMRVTFAYRGAVQGSAIVREDGRTWVEPWLVKESEKSDEVAFLYALLGNINVPLNLAPDGEARILIEGLGGASLVSAQKAYALARQHLASLAGAAPDHSGTGSGGAADWGLLGIHHRHDGWRIVLGDARYRVDVVVDDTTEQVRGFSATRWNTPSDRCGDEPVEHNGPHPGPNCPWGFTSADEEDQGHRAVGYRSEPYEWRLMRYPDPAYVYSSSVHGDPWTPMPQAYAGDPVSLTLVAAGVKGRSQAFMLGGHGWLRQPDDPDTPLRHTEGGVLPGRVFRLDFEGGGAGGPYRIPGDYLYQGAVQRFETEGGQWGILRVHGQRVPGLRALTDPPVDNMVVVDGGGKAPGPVTGPTPVHCGGTVIATLARTLQKDGSHDQWRLVAQPDGLLRTPGSGRGSILFTLDIQPHDPRREITLSAGTNSGWTSTVTPLTPENGKLRFCIDVARTAGSTSALSLTFDLRLKDGRGTEETSLQATMPFLPPADDSAPRDNDGGGGAPAETPSVSGALTVLVLAGLALVAGARRRRA